jgi:CheY-like chemotaxis protein
MFQRFTILLVDSDYAHNKHLATGLTKAGHHVLSARNGVHAHSILQYRGFDFLVMSAKESLADGVDLLARAKQMCPRPHLVVIGDGESTKESVSSLERGANLYLHKPVDAEHLAQYISRAGVQRSFSGSVDAVDILEYVQFLMLSGRETVLEVVSNLGTRAVLFLEGGSVVHAACGTVCGEEAFHRCMEFKGGTFSHLAWNDPGTITINKPGDFLLMEAARRRDRQRSGDVSENEYGAL